MPGTAQGREDGPPSSGVFSAAPAELKAGPVPGPQPPDVRALFVRRIVWLMLFRVVLVTLLLGTTVVLNIVRYGPDALAGPFAVFVFVLIGATYALNLAYIAVLGRVEDPHRFGLAQIAGDLAITSMLVHVTGGGASAFVFLYPVSTVAAAILFYRRGALLTAAAASALFVFVALAGHRRLIPPLAGQHVMPWELSGADLVTALVTGVFGSFAVGLLGSYLAGELGRAVEKVEEQAQFIGDLSALNAAIVRGLRGGLLGTDQSGRILIENQAACDLLGVRAGDAHGRPLREVVPELAELGERLRGAEPLSGAELAVVSRGGRALWLSVSVAPLANHRGMRVGHVFNFLDVTRVREMQEELSRAEHLAGVGRLAAAIAHELRNPLASISGSVELLAGVKSLQEEDRRLLAIVQREVRRLADLVDGVLRYARPGRPELGRVQVADLVEEVARVLSAEPGAGAVVVEIDGERPATRADAQQLRQVVWNLLRNAIEASPPGAPVQVRLGRRDDRVAIAVRDHGPGLPPEARAHLFEPFFTTKRRGTGLGLALVHRIVEQHAGSIDVEDAPGGGAVFTVWLPQA